MYSCTHVYVSYSTALYHNATPSDDVTEEAVLLVNIKGCGYPPQVDCKNFSAVYGEPGSEFPCYYSRENRTVVLVHYDREEHVAIIIHFFGVPFILTLATSVVLCVMYCDCHCSSGRSRRRRRTHHGAAIEDASEASVSTRVDMLTSEVMRPL